MPYARGRDYLLIDKEYQVGLRFSKNGFHYQFN